MPGDADFLLFPGREGPMSLNNHARIITALFALIGIEPPKVTHEFRVFAAQALHDMGISLEVRMLCNGLYGMQWAAACHVDTDGGGCSNGFHA